MLAHTISLFLVWYVLSGFVYSSVYILCSPNPYSLLAPGSTFPNTSLPTVSEFQTITIMLLVTHDSELMTQYVAATAIGSHRQFTIKDEAAGPMIISHGTDDKLYAILKDDSSQHALVDLGELLALDPKYTLSKFSVSQDVDNNDVYLMLATKATKTGDPDTLLVLKPFQPDRASLMGPNADLSSYIIPHEAGSQNRPIVDIFMVCHFNLVSA